MAISQARHLAIATALALAAGAAGCDASSLATVTEVLTSMSPQPGASRAPYVPTVRPSTAMPDEPIGTDPGDLGASVRELPDVLAASGLHVYAVTSELNKMVAGQPILGKVADDAKVAAYTRLLQDEYAQYPPAFFRNTGLKDIVICADLAYGEQKREASYDVEGGRLYFDARLGGEYEHFLRETMHHEYFHFVDLGPGMKNVSRFNWPDLNAPEFSYGTGGENMRNSDAGVLRSDLPGFLTQYATASEDEDRAETFSHLWADPAFVKTRVAVDPVLESKVERIKAVVAEIVPEMDETFWSMVSQHATKLAPDPSKAGASGGPKFPADLGAY
jgi:hypothetical protein